MKKFPAAKKDLTLLGIWNILPIGIWTWFNDESVAELERLTGRRLGTFCYIKNDLNYECFTQESTDLLKKDLDSLSTSDRLAYVQKISDDYYRQVPLLETALTETENKFSESNSNETLATLIENLAVAWSKVTMQCWYAVLIDIWYPKPGDGSDLKNIIAKSRDHCGHLHARSDKIEHQLYLEAAKRLGVSEREIYFMFQPEVVASLKGVGVPEELANRLDQWVATNDSGTFTAYGGDEAQKIIERFNVPMIGPKKEGVLKGTPASLGDPLTGRARVILLDKEFSEFQDDEILVSLQTMVHYLPIMKKAKAILTEFGGLTSHAAIVSRELKKPAIVGISGLISTIKTGDTLEIDAKAGTVKIL
jgi:phosphohistidine swiveling domain-containing protein